MRLTNVDIRQKAKEAKIPLWLIASRLCMHDAAFSRKLRFELTHNEKKRIFDIIDALKRELDQEEEAQWNA